jgi:DNA-binding transcriptional regulator/RsmH inhibitor MraZ
MKEHQHDNMFFGCFNVLLDYSRRFQLPAIVKEHLFSHEMMMNKNLQLSCLELRTSEQVLSMHKRFMEDVASGVIAHEDAQFIESYYFCEFCSVFPDRRGRITIPPPLCELFREKELVLLVKGHFIQIWNRSTYQEFRNSILHSARFKDISASMMKRLHEWTQKNNGEG